MTFLQPLFDDNGAQSLLVAAAIATGSFILLLALRGFINTRLRALTARTRLPWDDVLVEMLGRTYTWTLLLVSLLLAAQSLSLPEALEARMSQAVMALIFLQLGFWLSTGVAFALQRRARAHEAADEGASATALAVAGFTLRLALWSIILILILDQLGFNVTTLIASLGVGGVAVALAVQNILGDLFASLSIALDKPFVIGDFIIVGDVVGTVEHVGLKTTRIRALSGEQIVVANGDLLSSRIHNYKRLQERRIVFRFGVLYDTDPDTLEAIPQMIRRIIEATADTRFDRAHFTAFGDSSLDFEVVYHMLTADYAAYMDAQQRINLAMVRQFAEAGIGFAFPTRTLHLETVPAALAAHRPAGAEAA
jgi:small-conductance mechanosensitive channel